MAACLYAATFTSMHTFEVQDPDLALAMGRLEVVMGTNAQHGPA